MGKETIITVDFGQYEKITYNHIIGYDYGNDKIQTNLGDWVGIENLRHLPRAIEYANADPKKRLQIIKEEEDRMALPDPITISYEPLKSLSATDMANLGVSIEDAAKALKPFGTGSLKKGDSQYDRYNRLNPAQLKAAIKMGAIEILDAVQFLKIKAKESGWSQEKIDGIDEDTVRQWSGLPEGADIPVKETKKRVIKNYNPLKNRLNKIKREA